VSGVVRPGEKGGSGERSTNGEGERTGGGKRCTGAQDEKEVAKKKSEGDDVARGERGVAEMLSSFDSGECVFCVFASFSP
jgi:hypothetical protein